MWFPKMVSVNEVIFNQQILFRGRTLTLKSMEGSGLRGGGGATVERKGGEMAAYDRWLIETYSVGR